MEYGERNKANGLDALEVTDAQEILMALGTVELALAHSATAADWSIARTLRVAAIPLLEWLEAKSCATEEQKARAIDLRRQRDDDEYGVWLEREMRERSRASD